MLNLAELKQQRIVDDDDLIIRLAIDALYAVKDSDEHLRADRYNTLNPKHSISDYGHFWYSHLYEGGCYNFALTINIPSNEDRTWVRIIPAPSLDKHGRWTHEKGSQFDIRKPLVGKNDLKLYLRTVLDEAKKRQDRKPWHSPWE